MELKYLDKVRVTKGFYEGLTGIVTDSHHFLHIGTKYRFEAIKFYGSLQKEIDAWIHEDSLEKIEGGEGWKFGLKLYLHIQFIVL